MDLPPTPSQTIGPFFGFALPYAGSERLVEPGTPGAIRIEGSVYDGSGAPVPDAMIEICQATGFARCATDRDGRFRFITVKPSPMAAPDGRLQAPHIEVAVFARGLLRQLATRMYFPDEAANASDPVLAAIASPAARSSLVAHAEGSGLRFDIHLQGDRETTFFAF